MVPLPPQTVAHMAIMVLSTEILKILKSRDGPRMTSITIVRNAYIVDIVVEEVTQLMNVITYMVLHRTRKEENPVLIMPLQSKLQMRVRHLQPRGISAIF